MRPMIRPAPSEDDRRMDPRPPRQPRDTAAVTLAGFGVGAALYPLAFLLAQVFASSCRRGGLDDLGRCLLGGLASVVLAAVVLTAVAAFGLWRWGSRAGAGAATLSLFTAALLAWRLLYAFNDLQAVLGRGVLWVGVVAFPIFYAGWFLVLTRGGRLVGMAEMAGVLLLMGGFLAPALVEGTDRRQYESDERAWLQSLPMTIYMPTEAPAPYAFAGAEGRFASPPQVRLRYRTPDYRVLEITESQPYAAFAPPRTCGLGFPDDSVRDSPCTQVGTMPSGEPIWFRFEDSSLQPFYGVQLGTTVVTVEPPWMGAPRTPAPELVEMVRSLQPVPPLDLAARISDAGRG
jgi:hypothetical protein